MKTLCLSSIVVLLMVSSCSSTPEKTGVFSIKKVLGSELIMTCISASEETIVKGARSGAKNFKHTYTDIIEPATTEHFKLGDLNGDGMMDTAFVLTPPTITTVDENGRPAWAGCDKNCNNYITFSGNLPPLKIENSLWGDIANAGDLNGDSICELVFCSSWYTGSGSRIMLFTLEDDHWTLVSKVFLMHYNYDEPLKKRLIKKKGKYYLRGTKFFDGDILDDDVLIPNF